MDIRDHIHELTDSTKEKTMKPMKRDGEPSGGVPTSPPPTGPLNPKPKPTPPAS